jgi:hypothetical protein
MPMISTFASGSAAAVGGVGIAIAQKKAAPASKIFSITPSVSGKSTWNLDSDGALDLSSGGSWNITPTATFTATVKVWGAGGGTVYSGVGGAGGAANGTVSFESGVTYQLLVGTGGGGGAGNRDAGAGGAGSGIQFQSNSTAIIVAGGGGGSCGYANNTTGGAGAGGGTTGGQGSGEIGFGCGQAAYTGGAGTQSAAGAGGSGGRRSGAAGSGRNGGGLGTGSFAYAGGTGFGNGGAGAYNGGDQGSGGGGGGYFGGGEGGGHCGGMNGGGGSGYLHPSLVTAGTLSAGVYGQPGNHTDPNRGTAGRGGEAPNYSGNPGKIYMAA